MAATSRFAQWLVTVAVSVLGTSAAHAELYVIVNVDNPIQQLTQKEVRDIYMGRNRAFASGQLAQAFDLPRDHPSRAAFYLAVTGQPLAQVNSYWARLMFSGQTLPPRALSNESEAIDEVKRNVGAIAYVTREPGDKGLRTVLVLKEGP